MKLLTLYNEHNYLKYTKRVQLHDTNTRIKPSQLAPNANYEIRMLIRYY